MKTEHFDHALSIVKVIENDWRKEHDFLVHMSYNRISYSSEEIFHQYKDVVSLTRALEKINASALEIYKSTKDLLVEYNETIEKFSSEGFAVIKNLNER